MLYDFMLLLEKGAFYLAGERMKAPQFFNSIRGKSEVFNEGCRRMGEVLSNRSCKSGEEGWKAVWEKVLWGRVSDEKIKKKDQGTDSIIELERTEDILAYLGEHKKDGQFICGFSMETEHMVENSKKKLEKKHIDMVAANNLKVAGAGFGVDTNIMTLITKEGEKELPLMSKEDVANAILDEIVAKIN
jgi:hypothetical protein